MSQLFIDLETASCTNSEIIEMVRSKVKHPGNIKAKASIEKWDKEKRPQAECDAISKTSFNGLYGEIICIGYAVDDEPVKTVYRSPKQSETALLSTFWAELIQTYGANFNPRYVGHNVAGFDLPFLFKRCLVNNIKPTVYLPRNPKPWSRDVFDTLYETTGSLDAISKILGIGKKTEGIDGSKVNEFWLDGKIKEIAHYCENDVHLCREIYKRINFIDTVEDKNNPFN